MLRDFSRILAMHATNYRGWRTDRKIVVIESDDWGSACMPSLDVFQRLVQRGIRVDRCPYTSFDALASEEDLEDLFSALMEFRDKNGSHPVITANAVMMNPDFEKIRSSGFMEYHGEPFTETLKKYPRHDRSFSLWKQGMSDKLFAPQFHGREHLNVKAWMQAMQKRDSVERAVFNENMFWAGSGEEQKGHLSIRAAFDLKDLSDLDTHREILRDGLTQFEHLFGYKSESFIAPNFIYHPDLNQPLAEKGVRLLQGMKYQLLPIEDHEKRKMVRRIQGKQNELGQFDLVRNCVFEPSQKADNYDNIGTCMKGIWNAFFWKKPAIITAHRLNFIGYIHPGNREKNLALFRALLKKMLKRWPDIEFMTSRELGTLMSNSGNKSK
ncbi:hypothetical protein [Rhodohalobacter mucosus]|uniref:Polysaccharide deacetylase n=1 Tax=Rhodohalobacter mucosus TaxID=2079485 RepID=A0A316TX39_9BACT|nr:hypothetical protein [Rhodohalobacter mucosus]PWN07805.1 hypothetical protein DDZ15_01980 [Rhodohalobacter mucosus]